MQRQRNEDYFAIVAEFGLLLVADGVGGRPGGDVAAKLAVDTVHNALADPEATWPDDRAAEADGMCRRLLDAIALANRRIRERRQQVAHLERMATTLVAAVLLAGRLWVAHVGDSRAYLFRAGQLTRLTSDHSVGEDAVARARLTPEELAQLAPEVLTRAVGISETISPDVSVHEIRAGDVVLLATDGLTRVVGEAEIALVLDEYHHLDVAASALVDQANAHGGPDNITVVLGRWAL
jgi:serine/threonine protein phosphatase PrpC